MKKLLLVEDHWMPAWTALAGTALFESDERTAVQIAEDVTSYGLDPELYVAVVPAELGRAGVVNLNGRIYPGPRFAEQNAELNSRATGEFIAAEAGHPKGLPTFNVAARILSVEVVDAEGKAIALEQVEDTNSWRLPEESGIGKASIVEARGMLAFMNNPAGRNLWVCYRAGHELGTSSRSFGLPVPHKLEGTSPFLAANQEFAGQTIDIIEGQELVTYDIVTTPSAGTYIKKLTAEAADPSVESVSDDAAAPPQKEHDMPQPEALSADAIKDALKSVLDEQNGSTDDLATRLQTMITEAVQPIRDRLTEAEEKNRVAADEKKALAEKVEKMEREAAARERVQAMGRALTESVATVHPALAEAVRGFVAKSVSLGHITTPEKIADEVKRVAEAFEAISEATAKPAQHTDAKPVDADADASSKDEPAADLALFGEGWDEQFKQLIAEAK